LFPQVEHGASGLKVQRPALSFAINKKGKHNEYIKTSNNAPIIDIGNIEDIFKLNCVISLQK
jgi:hypothetical protein